MRILRLTLVGVLTLSAPIAAHAAQGGSKMGPAGTGPAPRFVQVWDGNGSGWHPAPGSWGGGSHPNPSHSSQWGGDWGRPHWGPNGYYVSGDRLERGAVPTPDGEAPTGPTAFTGTGVRCGILTQNGEARMEAGVIPSRSI